MKVLALVTDAFGGYGGIAEYNRSFLSALSQVTHVTDVHVMPRIAPDEVRLAAPHLMQDNPVQGRLAYALHAARTVLRLRPDVIYCGHLYHGPLAAMLARLSGARLVSQLHGTEIWRGIAPRHLKPLVTSDKVLAVSRDTQNRYRQCAAQIGDNSLVIPNTFDPRYVPGDRTLARQQFRLSDEIVIVTVARLDTREGYKGHDRVIAALPALRAHGRNVVYLVAGTGDDRPRLEGLARAQGVADHVRFLGKVPHDALPDLYRAADLFALPSTGEGFGIVYLEAMACGTPAIGLNVGGAPDALGDGELGWCVPPEQFPEALMIALDAPRPDAAQLHDAVQARYGQAAFRARVHDLVRSLH
jgi:phosphatidyl-myo-inositol dimannoside synthase